MIRRGSLTVGVFALATCAFGGEARAQRRDDAALRPITPRSREGMRPLREAQAVRLAVERNPGLRAAALDIQQSKSTVAAEVDRFPLTLILESAVDHSERPALQLQGGTTLNTSDSVTFAGELQKQFPWGTNLSFRIDTSVNRTANQLLPTQPDVIRLGPAYGIVSRFTVSQPLLRGFGRRVGEADLRQARFQQRSNEEVQKRIASELLRDTLTAYWELWYADEAVQIQLRALRVAERELDETKGRIDAGALPSVDIHSFATRTRELREQLNLAELDRRRRALDLGRRLAFTGRQAEALSARADRPQPVDGQPDRERLVRQALRVSPQLRQLEADIAAAEDRVRIAGEADRSRLDVTAFVQSQGLGNEELNPALEQNATFDAFSAQVGLTYQLPLTGSRYGAQQAAASRAVEAAEARKEDVRLSIETDVDIQRASLQSAQLRQNLIEETLTSARRQREAARERYTAGRGLPIEIERAEDAIRQAELRRARLAVDATQAQLALEHLTGGLLRRYRRLLELPMAAAATEPGREPGPF